MSRDIYTRVCNGESINDIDLAQAIKDYKAAETALFKLGPSFEIARKAITMTLITLEGFQSARNK
jgi:hypothetical protein